MSDKSTARIAASLASRFSMRCSTVRSSMCFSRLEEGVR